MKKIFKIIGIILIVIIVIVAGLSVYMMIMINDMKKKLSEVKIEKIDVKKVKNGEYSGECNFNPIISNVKVSVKDGKISNIELLEHRHGPGYGASDIIKRILDKQSLDVDAISGATGSSTVIRKSIEDALKKGL